MSLNWVMLSPQTNPPFTPLPGENNLFTTPPRVQLSIKNPSHYPAKQQEPFTLTHPSGIVFLTNRRIIYLPDKPAERLQSFAAPILNLHDSHVSAPFFGANSWTALCQPVQGGGLPTPSAGVLELKLTFKDGGAFDYHNKYEQVRERLQQAVEVSRINDDGSASSRAAVNGVDVSNVNLEDLPAYSEESDGPLIPPTASAAAAAAQASQHNSPALQQQRDSGIDVEDERPQPKPTDNALSPPNEPPPGYEEAQMAGLQDEVERRDQHRQ